MLLKALAESSLPLQNSTSSLFPDRMSSTHFRGYLSLILPRIQVIYAYELYPLLEYTPFLL